MKIPFSPFLEASAPLLRALVDKLSREFRYASILGTDCRGKRHSVTTTQTSYTDSSWSERGFVARVHNGENYAEYAFNELSEELLDDTAAQIRKTAARRLSNPRLAYPLPDETETRLAEFSDVQTLPDSLSAEAKLSKLEAMKNRASTLAPGLVSFGASYEEMHVSKIFLSAKKELRQAYVWSSGMLHAVVRREEKTRMSYEVVSGLQGAELLDELETKLERTVREAEMLLDAGTVAPGEYEIICSPSVTGVIAHESFGHGVETDMYVKGRAKSAAYLGKRVASPLVTLRDAARAARQTGSYAFDDEGSLGSDTVVIKDGVFQSGISDVLSASLLNQKPTGNGRRQSYERKAYARMTNTFIEPGKDKLDDMIASIPKGYLLEKISSGMEDPKNWGIQLMILYGREILDGKLTGNVVSPVILTGYVPDVLNAVSMVSADMELHGGACGKGYKEFAKVSDGGPYIKTRARLG